MPLNSEFWKNEEDELWAALIGVIIDALMDGTQGGIDLLPIDIAILVDFDLVNQAALAYARQYRYEWIHSITETTRTQVQGLFSEWIQSGAPLPELEKQLEPIFGQMRAEMIASTEVTRIFAEANQNTWKSTGFVGGKVWRTSADDRVCPICAPMHNVEVGLGNAFPNSLGGGYASPPAHPRCRCWLQPVVSVDRVLAEVERALNG